MHISDHKRRQQRVDGIGAEIVDEMRRICNHFRDLITKGVDLPAGTPRADLPAFKCTGDEVKGSLGENLKPLETVLSFVLDGKSNDITKAIKAAAKEATRK